MPYRFGQLRTKDRQVLSLRRADVGGEDIEAGAPEPTNGPYGYAKRIMLIQGAAYAAEYGFDCAFAVPPNLYGP